MFYRTYLLIAIVNFALFQSVAYSELTKQYSDPNYVEILLGDEDIPLFALGKEVLSSNDVQACSLENIGQMTRNIFRPLTLDQTNQQPMSPSKQRLENLLLGFPLKALNKLMAMGGFLTDFSDNNNPRFQVSQLQEIMGRYKLSNFPIIEARPKVKASNDKGCLLTFVFCPERLRCSENIVFQVPIISLSTKHQALIIDPNEFGIHLKKAIHSIQPYSSPPSSPRLRLSLKDHKTHLVAFDESILIFDVSANYRKRIFDPPPKVTTRWFLKFNLVESERDFQSRPPTKGIAYLLNTSKQTLYTPMRILRQRIFKDGKIKPIRYYVKNVPSRFQDSVRRGFEYWRSLFVSLIGHPVLSYYFIQGDFDGSQEVIAGDVRFNVLEWSFSKAIYNAMNITVSNRYTGEIWSSYVILPGAQLIDLYQEWFEYSQFVRASMLSPAPELTHPNALLKNLFGHSFQAPYSRRRPLYRSILLPLFPQEETFSSYISGFIESLVAHEIGHGLGLEHNPKASLFARGIYAGNSQMDYFTVQDDHKPISGEYDKMALAYGYLGIPPERTDMFCEVDQSPECRMRDQSSNPLGNRGVQLQEIVYLLSHRSHSQSSPYLRWNIEVQDYVTQDLNIILPFYYLADIHYDQLQTVLIDGRRAKNPQEVKDLVRNMLSDIFCDPELHNILNLNEPYQYSNSYDRQLQRNVNFLLEWSYSFIKPYIQDFQC